jgi:type VI secretion system protein ImpL
MSAFAYELASLLQAQAQAKPGDPEGAYAMPWYLVMGEPTTGRSTAIKAMNLEWPFGEGSVPTNVPDPLCTYWMPRQAVFIEPGGRVVGPGRQQGLLHELCEELKVKRPREPIDGIVLVLSAQRIADATEDGVDDYAKSMRRQLIEVAQALAADVPLYVVVTAYDNLWGFGDAFRWTQERRDEEPWGFTLPPGTTASDAPQQIARQLEGLSARLESMCFAKLSSEDDPAERVRAFQHLSESRDLVGKLGQLMRAISMDNAFERAPWIRALAIGSGIPGSGNQLRHGAARFANMGLYAPPASGTPYPGGMPLFAYLDAVLIPERDLVPTRIRWRDDKLIVLLFMLGLVAWLGLIIVFIARAVR